MLPMRVPTAVRNPRRNRSELVSSPVGSWINFNPLSLSPFAWYDASDSATITSSGGLISQWNDKSGNGIHVAQGTSGNQPSIVANAQNNLNGVSFGGDDFLTYDAGSDALVVAPLTVFVVAKDSNSSQASNTYRRVMSMRRSATTTVDYEAPNMAMGKNNTVRELNMTANGIGHANLAYVNNQAFVFHAKGTSAGCAGKLRNQYSTAVADAQPANMRYLRLGSDSLGSNPPGFATHESWVGFIYEALFFRQDMSDLDRARVEDYLCRKWGAY